MRKKGRKLPYFYNKQQLVKIVDQIEDPRIMMAFTLALFCGLRIGEVCKLKFNDIDIFKRVLKVRDGKAPGKLQGQYGKDRIVPIPDKVIPIFKMWKSMHNKEEQVFPTISETANFIRPQYMTKIYSKVLEKAELRIPESRNALGKLRHKYTFHTLRHTYATMLWEKTGDIYAVKTALGHSNLETTMIYTHISNKALSEKVNRAFEFGHSNMQRFEMAKQEIKTPDPQEINPLKLLQMRLAKGEIDMRSYRNIMNELTNQKMNYIG